MLLERAYALMKKRQEKNNIHYENGWIAGSGLTNFNMPKNQEEYQIWLEGYADFQERDRLRRNNDAG